jgi:nicotinate-nucleotide--dimethylbenzimidazole phosphoribosyltransferase
MTREQAEQSLVCGINLVNAEIEQGLDIVGLGEMGIGNTTPASAICAAITGRPVSTVTGRGTGLTTEQLAAKVQVIERALAVNRPDPRDALAMLSAVGGFEIGGLAGVILGAAARRVPVVVDGFITGSAALIACGLAPQARDYLIAAHASVEPGHRVTLDYLGLKPLLDLGMRLGEGTGAALALGLVEASVRLLNEMATFSGAGVTDKKV